MVRKTPPGQTRAKIYHFVREKILERTPPTIREVQQAFAFKSVQTAREHLEKLVEEGKLVKNQGISRGYRLPNHLTPPLHVPVPVLGHVQAGELTTAVEDPDLGYVTVASKLNNKDLFALKIRGQSMINAGIIEDDIVIVRRQPTARSGDIVVALVEDEATVKTLRFVNGKAQLHPENPAFEPITPKENDQFIILGKVIEIRRYLEAT